MAKVNFYKETTLPGTLVANSFYYVENGTYAEAYLTNSSGVSKMIGNSTMINALITTAISGLGSGSTIEIVADITARNALTLTANNMVLVTDASADSTVTSGAALYAYQHSNTTFIKVSEYESMDVTLDWVDIQNKPTSTVANIDDAVSKKHTHSNLTELNKIGEDVSGDATYGGDNILKFETVNW